MSRIGEIDVWHEGTDEELAGLLAGAVGKILDGHPELKCVHAAIEEEAPLPQARPAPRLATPEEIAAGKHLVPGPPSAPKMIHEPTPEPRPGRRRLRLNYRPA